MKSPIQKKVIWMCGFLLAFPAITAKLAAAEWNIQYQKSTLENGITLIFEKDTSSKITAVQIYIKGGKRAELPEKAGLAYLTTRLTLEFPDQDKLKKIMNQATQINFDCQNDYSLVAMVCLSENLEESLKIISQIMHKPLFSGIRINGVKKLMERMRDRKEDEPFNVAHQKFMATIFAKTPYGHPPYGTKESLKATKKKDITNFFENLYQGDNMVAVVSSDLEMEAILKLMNTYYGKFPVGKPQAFPAIELPSPSSRSENVTRDTQQSFVSAGFLLPRISPKNYILASMVENLLGKGINSRLWNLRVKEKLAYNVNAIITYCQEGGLLEAYLETENSKYETALNALKDTLARLHTQGITPEELEITKTFFKASFLRDNETKEERIQNLGYFEIMGLGFDFMHKFMAEVDTITLEEINTFIRDILDPDKGSYVIIGPETTE